MAVLRISGAEISTSDRHYFPVEGLRNDNPLRRVARYEQRNDTAPRWVEVLECGHLGRLLWYVRDTDPADGPALVLRRATRRRCGWCAR